MNRIFLVKIIQFSQGSVLSSQRKNPDLLHTYRYERKKRAGVATCPLIKVLPDQLIRPPIDQLKHVLDNEKSQNKSFPFCGYARLLLKSSVSC